MRDILLKSKTIVVSIVLAMLVMALIYPAKETLAQSVTMPEPDSTIPLDANWAECIADYNKELAFPAGVFAPGGQLIVKQTPMELWTKMNRCIAERKQKEKEWWFRRTQYLKNEWGMRFMTSIYGGLIDAMSMLAQRIAYEAASDLLYGNPGNEPRFWNDDFDTWLGNAMMDSSSKFIDRLDVVVGDWTQSMTATKDKNGNTIPGVRFSFCKPPDPYTLKLSLGLGQGSIMGPGVCNLKKVAENFDKIADMVKSGEAIQLQKPTVAYGSSDLSVGVESNSQYLNYMVNRRSGLENIRKEDSGFRPVLDVVSGKIKVPTKQAEDSWMKLSPVSMNLNTASEQRSAILSNYFMVGLENIPLLALSTFTNTFIIGALQKWLSPKGPSAVGDATATAEQTRFVYEALKNQDASGEAMDLYERQEFAKALGDYLLPNFSSTEDLDIIDQLTVCTLPRERFNCAMDPALGVAIKVGTRDGALTVGRAAGIGNEGATYTPSSQALHADWEMIPENDIKNNTDPTCAQRAYCAGNLKKMRLARIIPIGWELAANSPYNLKHEGKYITLGEVIRGFYDCNAEGQLDKDHPWCHLIDPNWILTSPKYQCRAKGFGDAILPDVGTRLEECGDVVSCLRSSQTGECTGGYGYCLAERPAWRFESKECSQNFVSCRTYNYSGGQISILRNTTDKGKCSEESVGCAWYATQRYVTSTKTPDGLWVGTSTTGPRLYMDKGVQKCSAEGCTKVYQFSFGQSALNLVQNGSFEQEVRENDQFMSFTGWDSESLSQCSGGALPYIDDGHEGVRALGLSSPTNNGCSAAIQRTPIVPGRYYTLTYWYKSTDAVPPSPFMLGFEKKGSYGNDPSQVIPSSVTTYDDCVFANKVLTISHSYSKDWTKKACKFVAPSGADQAYLFFKVDSNISFDEIQLEEGEVATPFVNGLATGLKEMYLKIAPDEYGCTGNDNTDNPACQKFARVCRQVDVGCQGYTDVDDQMAPEIPAKLSSNDLCPDVCKGYGEYRKLASTFDLVRNDANQIFNDPEDETTAYFIPDLSEKCSLEDVGCEAFTSMEAVTSTGEKVSHFKDIRLCEKPNDRSATYYTWEGSEQAGYQLKTWSLMASTTNPADVAKSPPKLVLRGGLLGYIKDPNACNDVSWKLGIDQDCRQFYDVAGNVYYRYYSQTISSDASCTIFRKDDSTEADCSKTGGSFITSSKSCNYLALPRESLSCSAVASGCRAYLGPTGRNSVNLFRDTFATGTTAVFEGLNGTQVNYSNESVIVGDKSLKMENLSVSVDANLKVLVSSTSSLARISFWAKSTLPKGAGDQPSAIKIDGATVGTFYPDVNWSRFEVGPFMPKSNPITVEIVVPKSVVYIDTFSVDQLNDVQFVLNKHWAIPLACDSTPEGLPEPRYMVGCREYRDRDSNPAFVRKFSSLCRDTAIGCKAFIDTNDKTSPYSQTVTLKGTDKPQGYSKGGAAKTYEEQFFGDWSATSRAYRYYYAIDDGRGRCDSSQASCRAYGKPVFRQDRLQLATTTSAVGPTEELYSQQKQVYSFETVLLKEEWDKLIKDDGQPDLACRKDELFCDRFQSGKVTEYFKDPGVSTCEWRKVVKLKKNDTYGIPADGEYGGWFRAGTNIPCYPTYLAGGNNYLIQYTSEADYAGWGAKCPLDQSECTELVDPNDTSDPGHPNGRSYYIINGPKLDKSTCGGVADPLSGCVLFRDMGIGSVQVNSQATYAKIMAEKGAPQTPIDCNVDNQNQYCQDLKNSSDPTKKINICISKDPAENGKACDKDSDCASGSCKLNDSNLIIKVKMDRECARWMGCKTGETVYDSAQQKFVTQCSQVELCQRNSSNNDDIYCGEFTDRSKEDFLKAGTFVDGTTYSARQIGFGKLDYSGLTSPFHYLLPDLKPEPVGYDLLKNTNGQLADKYINDKRLVAKLPLSVVSNLGNGRCKDLKSERIGYTQDGYCILPISEAQSLLEANTQQDAELNADNIAEQLSRGMNFSNARYQTAMPSPECQLYPEETSPLPTTFVESWDTSTDPPTIKKMVSGYEAAKSCVYGENCQCSYRKVRYNGNLELYYGMYGASPFVGVCMGGPREGQPCVNRNFTPVENGKLAIPKNAMEYNVCGDGGVCQEIQDVVYVNGKYGYCLERDLTRTIDAPQALAPCLTWAPIIPVGRYNPNHNNMTAGYLPTQGRGEYYCVSGTEGQKIYEYDHTTRYNSVDRNYSGPDFIAPGHTSNFECSYQNVMAGGSNEAVYLNQSSNSATPIDSFTESVGQVQMPQACRRSAVCQGTQTASVCSANEGLWIQTGPQHDKSYSEYFIPYKPALETFQNESYYDYYYGLFRFSLVRAPDGAACKWNPAWAGESQVTINASDFSCTDYLSQVVQKSNTVYDAMKQKFPGILDRRSENILSDTSQTPLRMRCMFGEADSGKGCYYKYWETDYNVESQDKMFDYPKEIYNNNKLKDPSQDTGFLSAETVLPGRCDSDHPYFGIRAVFQDVNLNENSMSGDMIAGQGMKGPWQFVGFWVTACMPYQVFSDGGSQTNADLGMLYMKLQSVRVDVCKYVAQSIEPKTGNSIAFTDRVWASGNFIAPYIGAKYDRINEPFGSALATRGILSDPANPMVIGDSIPASSDPHKTPTFPDAGRGFAADFVGTDMDPWFSLTNLFARIYMVYKWDVNQIYPDTRICSDWPDKQGTENVSRPVCRWLNDGSLDKDKALENIEMCTGWNTAKEVTDQDSLNQLWACNSLSGVNRGMSCGQDVTKTPYRNSDPVCHNAPAMFYKYEDNNVGTLTIEGEKAQELYGYAGCRLKRSSLGDPYLSLQKLSLYGGGKSFSLDKKNLACNTTENTGNQITMLKLDDGYKNMKTIIGDSYVDFGNTIWAYGGINHYYQDYLLTPEKIQDTVYFLMKNAAFMVNYDISAGFGVQSLCEPDKVYYKKNVYDKIRSGQSVTVNIKKIADLVVAYIQAAKAEQVTVSSYASRGNYDATKPPYDKVFDETLEARTAKNIAMFEIPSHWDDNLGIVVDDAVIGHDSADLMEHWNEPTNAIEALMRAVAGNPNLKSSYDQSMFIPEWINFGPFDVDKLVGVAVKQADAGIYLCEGNSVEPGKRCNPDYDSPLDESGDLFRSVDCPKVIKAAPDSFTTIASEDDFKKIFDYVDYTFGSNDQGASLPTGDDSAAKRVVNVPKLGFCLKDYKGQIKMDDLAFYNMVYHTNADVARETYLQDDLVQMIPGTGYCMGFNKFARCTKNSDCTFGVNQWWGMNDESGGKNSNYYGKMKELKIFSSVPDQILPMSARTVSLPTPYIPKSGTLTMEEIQKKYALPQSGAPDVINDIIVPWAKRLFQYGDEKAGEVDEADGGDCTSKYITDLQGVYYEAPIVYQPFISDIVKVYKTIKDARGDQGDWGCANGASVGDNTDKEDIKHKFRQAASWINVDMLSLLLRSSFFQIPNQYAREFPSIIDSAYQANSSAPVYTRNITVAPFAINFWPRFIKSIGYSAFSNIFYNDDGDVGIVGMWGDDDFADENNWDGGIHLHYILAKGFGYVGNYIIGGNGRFYDINGFLQTFTYLIDPKAVNDRFLWSDLFFTNLFSNGLASIAGGACYDSGFKSHTISTTLLNTSGKNDGIDFSTRLGEFFDLCDYFGFDGDYRTALQNSIYDRLNFLEGGQAGAGQIALNNIKLFDAQSKEMQVSYFEKTGWGISMPRDSSAFNLYPGVIPAAKGHDYNVADDDAKQQEMEKYNVYLPGHCEPPVGTQDATSKFKDFAINNDFPFAKSKQQWTDNNGDYTHRAFTDKIWVGPRILRPHTDHTWSKAHLFLWPWVDDDETDPIKTIDVSKIDEEHGMEIAPNMTKLFNASVSLKGGNDAVAESDFRGSIGSEPAGSLRTAYICQRTGEKVRFKEECNKNLIGTNWDYEKFANASDPLDMVIGENGTKVKDLCSTASQLDECHPKDQYFLPPDFKEPCVQAKYINGEWVEQTSDPDKDCNICTHSPGFLSYATKPLAYELGNPDSTNLYTGGGNYQHKNVPSATDVTFGLDNFYDMAGYSNTYQKGELIASYQPIPPRVAAPDSTRISDSANAQPVYYLDSFSVNNMFGGVVFLGAEKGQATVRFYAWASHDQAPLKKIIIDWGDGEYTRIDDSKIKNHKPLCNTEMECSGVHGLGCTSDSDCPPGAGTCMQTGRCENTNNFCHKSLNDQGDCGAGNECQTRMLFGNSSEDCQQGYFEFTHVYTVKENMEACGTAKRCRTEPNKLEGSCRPGEDAMTRLAPKNGCYDSSLKLARYTPRIMVVDNWNWCTGNCSEPNEANVDNFNNQTRWPIRHPNQGCWDGTSVRYNTDANAVTSPFPNECAETNTKGRPWVVFGGTIELSAPKLGTAYAACVKQCDDALKACTQTPMSCNISYNLCISQNCNNQVIN